MSDNVIDSAGGDTTPMVFTLDVDWAPDGVLSYVNDLFDDNGITVTWFATHDSSFLQHVRTSDVHEIGIHPNFKENSTQGNSPEETLRHLLDFYPGAISARTHGLLQSTSLMKLMADAGIRNDVSLFLYRSTSVETHVLPLPDRLSIRRFPYVWEDDFGMMDEESDFSETIPALEELSFVIFDFHPIHVFLNSRSMDLYKQMKEAVNLRTVELEVLSRYRQEEKTGTEDLLRTLIQDVRKNNVFQAMTIRELSNDIFSNESA